MFETRREELTAEVARLTSDLVAQRTVNAGKARLAEFPYLTQPGEESRAARVVESYLDKWSLPYTVHEMTPGRGNILARYGNAGKTLMAGLHLDVVPPGDGWSTDPFVVSEKDGKLYGRGVLDNKGPLAASLLAMRVLKTLGTPLGGTLLVAGIASEENREPGEPDPGIEYLLKEGLLKPDMAVIPDIGENMKRIDVAEKGRLVANVTAIGRQAHGSTPERGRNAVYYMARFVQKIQEMKMRFEPHPLLVAPTVNLGIIRGGAAANIVPGECMITLDFRYLPGQTWREIETQLRGMTCDVGGEWEISLESESRPHAVAADHALVKSVQSAAREVLGFEPEPFGMGGGTFAKAFNLGGIPAVGFGPGDDEAFHVANEFVETRQLVQFAEVLACLAVDVLPV